MKAKNNKTTTNGNPELIEALKAIEKEKDISKDILIDLLSFPAWKLLYNMDNKSSARM